MAKTKTGKHTTSKEATKRSTEEEYKTLTREELDTLAGEPLPERAAMLLINANFAVPVNAAREFLAERPSSWRLETVGSLSRNRGAAADFG